jgi:hypothetical protein
VQIVLQDQTAYLLHLVRLGPSALRLQVEDLFHLAHGEDVVVAPDAFLERKPLADAGG